MKMFIFVVFVLLVFSTINAEHFTLGDFKDPEFQRHWAIGIVTTEVGWSLVSVFTDRTKKTEWFDEEEQYHLRCERIVKPEHIVYKALGGIAMTILVMELTGQEWEPDGRAMNVGCFNWIGFRILIDMRWRF